MAVMVNVRYVNVPPNMLSLHPSWTAPAAGQTRDDTSGAQGLAAPAAVQVS